MTAQTKITPASGSVTDAARDLTGQCDRLTQALAERDVRTARHRAQYFADAATHLPKEPFMAKLEDALKDLAVTHRLTALSVNLYARADGTTWFGACAHSGGLCAHDDLSMASNASDAIKSAIEVLNAKRVAPVVVSDLEIAA